MIPVDPNGPAAIESQQADFSRAARWPAAANGFLWALGSGMVSIMLVIYLAQSQGANGVALSLIIAAPS